MSAEREPCGKCRHPDPLVRAVHWLGTPNLEAHLDIRDKVERASILSWVADTRSRYRNRVDESGAPMATVDAWLQTQRNASTHRDVFEQFHRDRVRDLGLTRREGEGASEFRRRCLGSIGQSAEVRPDDYGGDQVVDALVGELW